MKNRAEWRRWLVKNHARSPGIWLVFDKKSSRADRLAYADSVEEALCYGWIDSTLRPIDDAQYMQLFTPRKPKSGWSRLNKQRLERLIEQGLMAEAGLAAIEVAKANGSWAKLDAIEDLTIPDDLAAALAKVPDAARNFAAFAPSARKGYLHWVQNTVRPETRAFRVAEVVRHAAAGRKSRHLDPSAKTTGKSPVRELTKRVATAGAEANGVAKAGKVAKTSKIATTGNGAKASKVARATKVTKPTRKKKSL